MKLYLSSYHFGNDTEELEKWIQEHGNQIILIPNARDIYEDSERKANGIQKDVEELSSIGFDVKILSLKDYFGRQEQLKQDLKPYHAFWVIGGNAFALRKAMQLSGFDAFLKACSAKKDYLYGGYSAGICVLAPNLKGLHLVDEPVNPYNQDEVIQEGVGLLEFLPLPHYQSDHPESVLIDQAVSYCKEHQIAYQTLSDGDVIQLEI